MIIILSWPLAPMAKKNSKITVLKYSRHNPYVYKYKYQSYKKVYSAPPGMEELHMTSSGLWTLFESGAQYYDKKWKGTGLPFLYQIPKSHLDL